MSRSPTTSRTERLPFERPSGAAPRQYEPFVPGPNPKLPEFIARHATPYDPKTDTYDVAAFDRDLVIDKAAPPKAIYDMHTYWSKKHWAAIREYVRHYLPEKHYPRGTGLVLDCFSGSGMTGVAAMMEDRPCVLIDASPAAAFISHCYTHPVDPDALQAAYDRMMTEEYPPDLNAKLRVVAGREIRNLTEELDWLYETRCDRCGGRATTEYVVYSERFQCPACAEVVALFDCPEVAEAQSLRKARQTGLGRRIRQFVAFLRGEGDYPRERMPDAKTLVGWLKHCRAFGLAEEGVVLFEKSGLIGQLAQLSEDDRYDAQEYYADCRRKAGKSRVEEDEDEEPGEKDEDEG